MPEPRFASARASAMAKRADLDPTGLTGTGHKGAIRVADVKAALSEPSSDDLAAPGGLRSAGQSLWHAILGDLDDDWELDRRELHLLERACRCEDQMRELEAVVDSQGSTTTGSTGQIVVHPGLLEARQLKITQLRLLQALELEDPTGDRSKSPAAKRGARAANARWSRRQLIEDRRAAAASAKG